MDKAFEEWTSILQDLEVYADNHNFDLKGVKIWANIFWGTNGKIEHFVFYPKPNSKYRLHDKMKEIVAAFIKTYPAAQPASKNHILTMVLPHFPFCQIGRCEIGVNVSPFIVCDGRQATGDLVTGVLRQANCDGDRMVAPRRKSSERFHSIMREPCNPLHGIDSTILDMSMPRG